jgi:hypothetical protein
VKQALEDHQRGILGPVLDAGPPSEHDEAKRPAGQ